MIKDEEESTIYEIGCMKALEDWFERNSCMINLTIFFVFSIEVRRTKIFGVAFVRRICLHFGRIEYRVLKQSDARLN